MVTLSVDEGNRRVRALREHRNLLSGGDEIRTVVLAECSKQRLQLSPHHRVAPLVGHVPPPCSHSPAGDAGT